MPTLIRKAKGLPRFMLDCGWWRSRHWTGAGLAAIGLQTCAISYCYEHGSDGRVPKEDLALALGLREKEVKGAVAVLLKKGRWVDVGDEYEIVGYLGHNPSQAEIEEYRTKKSLAGQAGNHEKWHVKKGIIDAECPLCIPPATPPPTDSGSQSESHLRPPDSRTSEAEPSHPESLSRAEQSRAEQCQAVKGSSEHSSASKLNGVGRPAVDDDEGSTPISQTLDLIADRRIGAAIAAGLELQNPGGYRHQTLKGVNAEFGDDVERLICDGLSPREAVDELVPERSAAAKRYPDVDSDAGGEWVEEADDDGRLIGARWVPVSS